MKHILITGANRGIGLELARQLDARGDSVIAAVRQAGQDLPLTRARIIENADTGTEDGVAQLAARLGHQPLDWLINNAGILERDGIDQLDFAAVERQFRINALGPLRVTLAPRRNLRQGSRVFMMSSTMGSISDNSSGGYYGYRMSKAGLNMAARSLAVDLRGEGVSVFMLHPGYVATDMTGHQGPVSPPEAAANLIRLMDKLAPESSGTFWHARGHELTW